MATTTLATLPPTAAPKRVRSDLQRCARAVQEWTESNASVLKQLAKAFSSEDVKAACEKYMFQSWNVKYHGGLSAYHEVPVQDLFVYDSDKKMVKVRPDADARLQERFTHSVEVHPTLASFDYENIAFFKAGVNGSINPTQWQTMMRQHVIVCVRMMDAPYQKMLAPMLSLVRPPTMELPPTIATQTASVETTTTHEAAPRLSTLCSTCTACAGCDVSTSIMTNPCLTTEILGSMIPFMRSL